jgi:peroxin-16
MDVRYDDDGGIASATAERRQLYFARNKNIWKLYQAWVQTHQNTLMLADETISRLLLWTPHAEASNTSRWREIIWGFLSLHRLAVDLALRDDHSNDEHGTSIHVPVDSTFPATSIRIALTVLQCLGPIAQELVVIRRTPPSGIEGSLSQNAAARHDARQTVSRQARVRLHLEKARLALRAVLLIGYWRRMWQQHPTNTDAPNVPPGLLMDGGLYHIQHSIQRTPTVEQERARVERQQYRGRRTNRRVVTRRDDHSETQLSPERRRLSFYSNALRVVLGELLYIIRPLYWAQAEDATVHQDSSKRWKAWAFALGIDLASLASLKKCKDDGNEITKREWSRRRMRLLLYLLRSPIWERYSQRGAAGLSGAVEVVPLLGKLLTSYLWDWLYYWKLYRAEEG